MQESFETPEIPEAPEGKPRISALTLGMGIVVALAILVSLWFLFQPLKDRKDNMVQQTITLNMAPSEQTYAKKIEIGKIALSRAENFLHQEVTTMSGEVYNGGPEPVLGLSITTEFLDEMNQVVLRETRKVLGTPDAALAPGEHRAFEISFEHVPNSWNMQPPTVRVASLQLLAEKP